MFLDLKDIGRDGVAFDHRAAEGAAGAGGRDADVVRRARIVGTVVPTARGLELRARVTATFDLPCDRCLEVARVALEDDVALVLTSEPEQDEAGEIEIEAEDTERFPVRADRLDLAALLDEQVVLLRPHKFVCRPECRGLCPECGGDRNRVDCACESGSIDPRLAPLARFRARRDA